MTNISVVALPRQKGLSVKTSTYVINLKKMRWIINRRFT